MLQLLLLALASTPSCPEVKSLQPAPNQGRSENLPEAWLLAPEVMAARPCASTFTKIDAERPQVRQRTVYRWSGERLLAWVTDGEETVLDYDDCGRLIRVGRHATFRYDARGFPQADRAEFTFDEQGRLVSERSASGTMEWVYSPLKVTRRWSSGARSEVVFDSDKQVKEERIFDDHGQVVVWLRYRRASGRQVVEERGGDGTLELSIEHRFDARGRLVDIVAFDPSGQPTQSTHYVYDCR